VSFKISFLNQFSSRADGSQNASPAAIRQRYAQFFTDTKKIVQMKRLLVFLIFFVASCETSEKKRSIRDTLTDNCYWDVIDKQVYYMTNACYRFMKDGKCDFFYYNFRDKKRINTVFRFDFDDVIVSKTWLLQNDNTLNIQGINYNITCYNQDTIVLKNILSTIKADLVLVKNCTTVPQ